MTIPINSRYRVIKGSKLSRILVVGVLVGRKRLSRREYWVMDVTAGTKGLVTARELEDNCEKLND